MKRLVPIGKSALIAIVLSIPCAAALAETVSVDFDGISPGKSFSYKFNGGSGTTTAGMFHWDTQPSSQVDLGNFVTFCVELAQTVGDTVFTIVPVENAPSPGAGVGGVGSYLSMGITKANQIRELWGRYFDTLLTGTSSQKSDKTAAFQIAIWEIVHDNDNSLAAGHFQAKYTTQSFVQLAQSWLNSLTGDVSKYETDLVGLSSPTRQDHITVRETPEPPPTLTPEPSSLVLFGIGAIGLCAKRRRKKSAPQAIALLA